MSFKRVLIALKGKKSEDKMVRIADRLAASDAEIRAVHVIDVPRAGVYGDELKKWHDRMVRRISERVSRDLRTRLAGLESGERETSIVLTEGRPSTEIIREADEFDADLVIAGGAAHSGMDASTLGTDIGFLIQRCPRLLLVAGDETECDAVVAPVNFSDLSRRGVKVAAEIAGELDKPLHIVHVISTHWPDYPETSAESWWDSAYAGIGEAGAADAVTRTGFVEGKVKEFVQSVCGEDVEAAVTVLDGSDPGHRIGEFAESLGKPLVVVGSLGRSLGSLTIGRTAERIFRRARCSILTFKSETAAPPRLEERSAAGIREVLEA